MNKVFVIGYSGVHAGNQICVENELLIGRDARVCQLVYPKQDREVSGVHCKIQNIDGEAYLTDMNSTNGTFLDNGTKIITGQKTRLQNGQGFYLGSRQNSYSIKIETEQQIMPQAAPQVILQETPKKQSGALGIILGVILVVVIAVAAIAGVYIVNSSKEEDKGRIESTIEDVDGLLDTWLD